MNYDTITIPSQLDCFVQEKLPNSKNNFLETVKSKNIFTIKGTIPQYDMFDLRCKCCGSEMHAHGSITERLTHIPLCKSFEKEVYDTITDTMVKHSVPVDRTEICIEIFRYRCPKCSKVIQDRIPFKAKNHRITEKLYGYVCGLLEQDLTLTKISKITGLHVNTVKDIDKERLTSLYTENGELKKPQNFVRILAIDEFKLHDGHRYATVIMDAETKDVIFIRQGKSKQVVSEFVDFVGPEWMRKVESVACDMNAGFYKEFMKRCPHLKIVFDRFHIMKHFNEDVISAIRKDEVERLKKEGRDEEARRLKGSQWILAANRDTIIKWDQNGEKLRSGEVKSKVGGIFNLKAPQPHTGYEDRLKTLLQENGLLMTADIIREKLRLAYEIKTVFNPDTDRMERYYAKPSLVAGYGPATADTIPGTMKAEITEVINLCRESKNHHLEKFANLLSNHIDGIVTHESTNISSGIIEGFNNKIKTIRRNAYGFRDDEYFFLKIMDTSRR